MTKLSDALAGPEPKPYVCRWCRQSTWDLGEALMHSIACAQKPKLSLTENACDEAWERRKE